jgi:hypothetical protein
MKIEVTYRFTADCCHDENRQARNSTTFVT